MEQSSIYDENYIIGEVERVIFQSEKTRFFVLKVTIDETNTNFVFDAIVTGYFHDITEGETYRFTGGITNHARFGEQFNATHFKRELPKTDEGVIQYLASDTFKGIGLKTAEKIVAKLGYNALEIISDDKDALKAVGGLSRSKIDMIHHTILENKKTEEIIIRLNELGFGARMSAKILKHYGDHTLKILEKSPYRMVADIDGIGFNTADKIALAQGIQPDDIGRLKAGLLYIVEDITLSTGHTYIGHEILNVELKKLLEYNGQDQFEDEDIEGVLTELKQDEKIVVFEGKIYLPTIFYAEHKSADEIYRIVKYMDSEDFDEEQVDEELEEIERDEQITYNDEQTSAIHSAVNEKISIITGGPGTGKTTIVKGIIGCYHSLKGYEEFEEYDEGEYPIKLVAPTGRAAKRLSESTGIEASTIHRLIGWGQDTEKDDFLDIELNAKMIIIDEMSMVDTWLFYQLLRNVPSETKLVFVGDRDQLPSVGPGKVFNDLIESDVIKVTELTKIYRQGEGSSIIKLAHDIKEEKPIDIRMKFRDRVFITANISQISGLVDNIVSRAVEKGYDMRDIQVLAPIYRGNAGINKLNQVLQEILNPLDEDKEEIKFGDIQFRTGDKVLQLINRREDNIFNGDSGIIDEVILKDGDAKAEKDMLIVDYDGRHIAYERKDLSELAHAYCTSIHKAQGSEYPIVIMPLVKSYRHMLIKNIIYTGITRAKESLILCGDEKAFYDALSNEGITRHTTLIEALHDKFGITQEAVGHAPDADHVDREVRPVRLTEENLFKIPAMINMDKTPYDFS
ncbi:SF1B family DNA helicase RecD2 [Lacicoccus alkaliphilus]|uniref:ATP-dependent RecD2 DNA helicase n=1 Tax=Lacicoccus alkaliphilus DSM 16010 TaxID=1123231 RepID=A0A1M7BQ93_9BACL|nr:ATP-dependent RecD-like DNA helicase [Salinicoccus alkaliphilus]SHL57097.1 exodeoxyribonuclease V alpha subunit [Salinicoccus alkaliphilus DSM 16010]